jgi:Tfp pilus assembly protein PilO
MMTLFRRKFSDIPKRRYLETIKLFPGVQHENTQKYTTVILTFAALIFFGLFAINPTLSTITKLQKELEDSKFVEQELETKINNMSLLQQRYSELSSDMPNIFAAIPDNAQAVPLAAQIQALAKNANISLSEIQVNKVDIAKAQKGEKTDGSFTLSFTGSGQEPEILAFIASLTDFDRIITFEEITVARDDKVTGGFAVTVLARSYFKYLP